MVVKYADNILKTYATCIAIVLTALISGDAALLQPTLFANTSGQRQRVLDIVDGAQRSRVWVRDVEYQTGRQFFGGVVL